ncbi:MAG: hypothetical protein M3P18_02315 [Actinomycetota bacterium]|nr:hypothetical protein [Actinomycetota bacterium]
MTTMSDLIEAGVQKMRLPFWNPHAYAVPRPVGPWADTYDMLAGIGSGDPVAVLIIECDLHDNWEPVLTEAEP